MKFLLRLNSLKTKLLKVWALEVRYPDIKQVFITGVTDADSLERTPYIIRKKIEKRVRHTDFYIVSLSAKNIIYKGCLLYTSYSPSSTKKYSCSQPR